MKAQEQSSTSTEVPKTKSALLDKYKKEPKKDEASAIKSQEIEAASSVLEYLLPKEVEEYDEGI